jgi:DNA-binding PadR family transcriptional regulator
MAVVLGAFEQAVLLAVVRLRDDAYGRRILGEVRTRLRREVAAGALYTTLDRLEQRGLISSRLESGDEVREGRPRRFYAIGSAGVRALNDARAAVDHLWRGIRWPLKGES